MKTWFCQIEKIMMRLQDNRSGGETFQAAKISNQNFPHRIGVGSFGYLFEQCHAAVNHGFVAGEEDGAFAKVIIGDPEISAVQCLEFIENFLFHACFIL